MSAQVTTCAIQVPSTGEQFVCFAVYAYNTAVDRILLWEELRGAKAAYDHLNLPWILIGDFNETLASSEHSRTMDYRRDMSGMRHFQEAMTDCSVMDLSWIYPLLVHSLRGGTIELRILLARSWTERWLIRVG